LICDINIYPFLCVCTHICSNCLLVMFCSWTLIFLVFGYSKLSHLPDHFSSISFIILSSLSPLPV
jgi:hypothetical protein